MDEMDAPVTRRELKEELGLVREEMAVLRTDLTTEMAVLRTDLTTQMAVVRTELAQLRTDVDVQHRQLIVEMGAEISRQFGVALETVRGWIRAVDDQYRDLPKRVATIEANELPDRVKKLEDAVFAPPPASGVARRASARARSARSRRRAADSSCPQPRRHA